MGVRRNVYHISLSEVLGFIKQSLYDYFTNNMRPEYFRHWLSSNFPPGTLVEIFVRDILGDDTSCTEPTSTVSSDSYSQFCNTLERFGINSQWSESLAYQVVNMLIEILSAFLPDVTFGVDVNNAATGARSWWICGETLSISITEY